MQSKKSQVKPITLGRRRIKMQIKNKAQLFLVIFPILFLASVLSPALTADDELTPEQRQRVEEANATLNQGGNREKAQKVRMDITRIRGQLRNLETSLQNCKTSCVRSCEDNCYRPCEEDFSADCGKACAAKCTEPQCEATKCSGFKQKHDNHKQKLADAEAALRELGDKDEDTGDDVVAKVKATSKKTNALAIVALTTTVGLGYTCHSYEACCNPWSGYCCKMAYGLFCPMTALAGIQTAQMFKKKRQLDKTACDMMEAGTCGNDGDGDKDDDKDDDDDEKEEDPDPELSEVCSDKNCEPVMSVVNPDTMSDAFIGGDTFFKNLKQALKLKKNPFKDYKKFDYNKLTKKQKKAIQKVMGPINEKNKAFLAKHGIDLEEDSSSVVADGSGLSGTFTGGESNSHHLMAQADSESTGLKKKNPFTDKMKKMWGNFYGKGGGKDFLSDKSVQIGDDLVGVSEDNIFKMASRRHRAMDRENYFIKK